MTKDLSFFLFILLALVAEVLGTVGGFGSSILFVPLANFFFDLKAVLAITAVFHVFSNAAKLGMFYKHIDYKLSLLIGIPAVAFVILGAYLSNVVPENISNVALAFLLIGLSLLFLLKPDLVIPPSKANSLIGGMVSGFLAGIIGTGGAIRGMTLTALGLPKNVFVGTSALIDMGVDLSRSVVYIEQGYFEKQFLIYIPALIGVAWLGTWLGKLILNKLSEEAFKKVVLVFLLVLGISMLVRVWL